MKTQKIKIQLQDYCDRNIIVVENLPNLYVLLI